MTRPPFGFGITWDVTSGDADTDDDIINLSDALPFDPDNITQPIEQPDYFASKFKWDSVELKYTTMDDDYEPLGRFNVTAKVFVYTTSTSPDGGNDTINAREIPYELESMTIYSDDPNSGDTWVFPDDYPEQVVDPNHPTQYGGVIMRNNTQDGRRRAGEYVTCGLEDGPDNDAIVPWLDTRGRTQEAISAYNYMDVFDQTEFSYIPMNSNTVVSLKDNEKFRFTPLYPDVLDENGKHAPIYPMNTVTTFKPDGRDNVTVTYKVKIKVKFAEKFETPTGITWPGVIANAGDPIPVQNPEATVKQTCVQDVSDYAQQMQNLFQYCNWSNPGGYTNEELAPNYPLMYPYTSINGFEGLAPGEAPKTRGDDKDNEPLERGDVWYNPETEKRQYYNIADVPEKLEVVEGGKGYKDRDGVVCVWLPPADRCYKITDQTSLPFGLMCDIKTEDGEVVSATVSDTGSPSGWTDGDIIAITGGRNNARARVSIKKPAGWTDKRVEIY